MSSDKIVVGYWNIRALVAPIQYLLQVSGLDHEVKLYDFKVEKDTMEGVMGEWLADKPNLGLAFPNLPYLIDGDVKLTQSLAIMRYLARKAGLFGVPADATAAQIAQLDLIEQQANDLRWNYINYGVENPLVALKFPEGFPASIVRQLAPVASWLKDKFFVMGDNICYVDLILFEVLDVFKMINPDCLASYPGLVAYEKRIRDLPAMKNFLESSECIQWPVLGPIAKKFGWTKEQQ